MLAFLLAWLLLAAVCVPPGLGLLRLVGAGCFERPADRFVLAAWLGLVLLSTALLVISFFAPLTPLAGAAAAAALALPPLASRGTRREFASFPRLLSAPAAAGLAGLALGVALLATQQVWNFDVGLYHYGLMKWLGTHGAVRGLGLLHYRFALATSWFALGAVFDAGPLVGRMTAVPGGFALLLSLVHLAAAGARCLGGRARRADWLLVVASGLCTGLIVYGMMPKPVYWKAAVMPSPDFPVNVLTVLIAWAVVLILESGEGVGEGRVLDAGLVPLVLAAGALAMKVSAAPLVVAAGLFYVLRGGPFMKRVLVGVAVSLPFVAAVLAYQTIASGCPLFPAPLCLDVPWTVGAERASDFMNDVKEHGRWLGAKHDPADRFGWIGPWLLLGLTRMDAALMAGAAATALAGAALGRLKWAARVGRVGMWAGGFALAVLVVFRAQNIFFVAVTVLALVAAGHVARKVAGGVWLVALGLAGNFLTLYGGPALRFAVGYVAVLAACLALLRLDALRKAAARAGAFLTSRAAPQTVFALLLLAFGVAVNADRAVNLAARALSRDGSAAPAQAEVPPAQAPTLAQQAAVLRSRLLLPPPLHAGEVSRRRVNNLDYFVAEKYQQCWASELPCAPGDLPPYVALRDPAAGLGSGFVNTGR